MFGKKLIAKILLLILLSPQLCWGALSAGVEWEVRTTGTTTAGCGFLAGASGTDRSQQDAVQTTFTDLVIGNPTTTDLTSAANPFGATDVGNIINITSGTGFTTGYYEVISVAGSTATMDRAVGTAGSTGGNGILGGGCSEANDALDTVVAGNTVWVKAGTYAEIFSVATTNGGNGTPIIVEGYNASHGDNPTGTNRPLINGGDTRANCFTFSDNNGWQIKNFECHDATGDGFNQAIGSSGNLLFINIRSYSNTGDGFDFARHVALIGVESDTNSGAGVKATNDRTWTAVGCYIHDNTGAGWDSVSSGSLDIAVNNIFDSNASNGMETSTAMLIMNNVFFNNTGASSDGYVDLIASNANVFLNIILNNSSSNNGSNAFGLNGGTDVSNYFDFNNYNGHTTELNNITAGDNDTGDVSPGFTSAAGGDFTVAAGSALINAAMRMQTYNAGITGTYMWNIGVDMDDTVTATGGASNYTFVQ